MFKITIFGHAFCLVEIPGSLKIAMDPFDPSVGYKMPDISADVVTVSHDHFDHSYVEAVKGNPKIFKEPCEEKVEDTIFKGIQTFHDNKQGKVIGSNIIWVIRNKLNIAHTGDLGHDLNLKELKEIGEIDILLLTVGGTFTIGPEEATRIMDKISPKIVIPVHYLTPKITIPLTPLSEFLKGKNNIDWTPDNFVEIDESNMPDETRIMCTSWER